MEPEDIANSIHYLAKESETANTKLLELKPHRKEQFRGSRANMSHPWQPDPQTREAL